MIFQEFELLDKDGEVDHAKLQPFIDAQMKNFSESSDKDAASISLWTPIIKESFEICPKMSSKIHKIYDIDTKTEIKSTEHNIEPLFIMMCNNIQSIAVIGDISKFQTQTKLLLQFIFRNVLKLLNTLRSLIVKL